MSLTDLLTALRALSRAEKAAALHFLEEQLREEEKLLSIFKPGTSYPGESPCDSPEAAVRLQELLDGEKAKL